MLFCVIILITTQNTFAFLSNTCPHKGKIFLSVLFLDLGVTGNHKGSKLSLVHTKNVKVKILQTKGSIINILLLQS